MGISNSVDLVAECTRTVPGCLNRDDGVGKRSTPDEGCGDASVSSDSKTVPQPIPHEGTPVPSEDVQARAPEADESPEVVEEKAPGKLDPQSPSRRRRPHDPVLARAFRTGRPIEGRVEKAIKGGFEIRIAKCRGFCPYSQMDLHRVEDPAEYAGRSYFFRVIQFRRGGEDVVLSRRALLEEDRSEEAKAVRATLIEGAITRGRVVSLADFGAFVDLGAGVTGLVHISELAHTRVSSARDAVKPDDWVPVRILKLDDASGRISLSIRQVQEDPWDKVSERFQVGGIYPGKVMRIVDFGAFVELAQGIEVLAHNRDFPPSAGDSPHGLETGQDRNWLILAVESDRHRMTVAPMVEDEIPQVHEVGSMVKGKVQRVEKFGVFVWLGPGKVGMIPSAWTGTAKGSDLKEQFSTGKEIEVEVVDVSSEGRRFRLALKGVDRGPLVEKKKPARRASVPRAKAPSPTPAASVPNGFGNSLGDALKAALEKHQGNA